MQFPQAVNSEGDVFVNGVCAIWNHVQEVIVTFPGSLIIIAFVSEHGLIVIAFDGPDEFVHCISKDLVLGWFLKVVAAPGITQGLLEFSYGAVQVGRMAGEITGMVLFYGLIFALFGQGRIGLEV